MTFERLGKLKVKRYSAKRKVARDYHKIYISKRRALPGTIGICLLLVGGVVAQAAALARAHLSMSASQIEAQTKIELRRLYFSTTDMSETR